MTNPCVDYPINGRPLVAPKVRGGDTAPLMSEEPAHGPRLRGCRGQRGGTDWLSRPTAQLHPDALTCKGAASDGYSCPPCCPHRDINRLRGAARPSQDRGPSLGAGERPQGRQMAPTPTAALASGVPRGSRRSFRGPASRLLPPASCSGRTGLGTPPNITHSKPGLP